jgi:hypothetical protein
VNNMLWYIEQVKVIMADSTLDFKAKHDAHVCLHKAAMRLRERILVYAANHPISGTEKS